MRLFPRQDRGFVQQQFQVLQESRAAVQQQSAYAAKIGDRGDRLVPPHCPCSSFGCGAYGTFAMSLSSYDAGRTVSG